MRKIFLLCGKVGSGKSTLAKLLEEHFNAVPFSMDDFMLGLYGEVPDRDEFTEKVEKCKKIIYQISDHILKFTNVSFELGCWKREEREATKKRFPDYKVIIIYLKVDKETLIERLKHRNNNLKENEYLIDEKTFNIFETMFEEPDDNENVIIYKNDKQLINEINKI